MRKTTSMEGTSIEISGNQSTCFHILLWVYSGRAWINFQKFQNMEDDLNGRRPQWKMTSMEDDSNGRRPQWKKLEIRKTCFQIFVCLIKKSLEQFSKTNLNREDNLHYPN
jgi:hypothetical protein